MLQFVTPLWIFYLFPSVSLNSHVPSIYWLTNLAIFTITSGTFRFFGVCLRNFCPYEIILMVASFYTNHSWEASPQKHLRFSFVVRIICASFKTFWKSLSNGWYVRLSTSWSSNRGFLSLLSNAFLDIAPA